VIVFDAAQLQSVCTSSCRDHALICLPNQCLSKFQPSRLLIIPLKPQKCLAGFETQSRAASPAASITAADSKGATATTVMPRCQAERTSVDCSTVRTSRSNKRCCQSWQMLSDKLALPFGGVSGTLRHEACSGRAIRLRICGAAELRGMHSVQSCLGMLIS
jgi:hypothetical protein